MMKQDELKASAIQVQPDEIPAQIQGPHKYFAELSEKINQRSEADMAGALNKIEVLSGLSLVSPPKKNWSR